MWYNTEMGLSKTKAAYLAGLIDGEASVSIQRMKYDGKNPAYAVSVRIYSTNRNVLRTVKNWLKVGSLRVTQRPNNKWKPLWRLYILSNQAIEVLKFVLPFLQIKRKHAINAIEFQRLRRRTGVALTSKEKQRQKRHYETSKQLNRRGR